MSFSIHTKTAGDLQVLRVAGRLVLGDGTSGLRNALSQAAQKRASVLLDLSGVSYIDSAGLGELVAGLESIRSQGREMKLLRPAAQIDSLLHITRLYTTFEVFEDEPSALATFA